MKIPVEQAWAFRHARHRLLRRAPQREWPEVIRKLVGLQAQMASAAWASLWARVEGLTREEIERGLTHERTIARTWCMRGTVHLVHRDDHSSILRALGPAPGEISPWLARRGITAEGLERLAPAIRDALTAGPLSRRELAAIVTRTMPEAESWFDSWGGVLSVLARLGVIVFGPPRSNETTFVRCDHWWPAVGPGTTEGTRTDQAEAPEAWLLRRYLGAFGPATRADFTYWSGLKAPRVTAAVTALATELLPVEVEGRAHWLLPSDLAALKRARTMPPPRLLPHFDVALLGHRDRAWLVEERHRPSVFRAAGWVAPTILIGGQVTGTWSARREAGALEVTLTPFRRLRATERDLLEAEAASLARFLGVPDVSFVRR